MATEQNIKQLFERYLLGQCNAEEITQLYDHFGIEANQALLEDHIADTLASTEHAPRTMVYQAQQVADRVSVRLREYVAENQPNRRMCTLRWLPYVAAAIVVLAISWWVIGDRLSWVGEGALSSSAHVVDIAPGANRAKLTLADGHMIDLSEAQSGIVVGDGISYLDGSAVSPAVGKLGRGEVGRSGTGKGSLSTNYNLLSTPKGGTYQITLPDGSIVWLNAASTLRYPSRFSDEERVVFLEGEAYFEVSEQTSKRTSQGGSRLHTHTHSQKIPFKVITNGQTIEVLGTEFNISAYPEEAEAKTTLVKGSINVSNLIGHSSNILTPGQQATMRGSNTDIVQVGVDQYTAWKSGRFHFDHTPFNDMIRQVARWYDVEVIYRGDVPKETFSGKMGRELSLMEMLDLMDISDAVIQLEGHTLIVQ